jgi:hypothetical protein
MNSNFSGIFYETRATLLSASIPKYVSEIHGCTVQVFSGSVEFAITNVGTKNVSSSQSVNTILSYYGDLIIN